MSLAEAWSVVEDTNNKATVPPERARSDEHSKITHKWNNKGTYETYYVISSNSFDGMIWGTSITDPKGIHP